MRPLTLSFHCLGPAISLSHCLWPKLFLFHLFTPVFHLFHPPFITLVIIQDLADHCLLLFYFHLIYIVHLALLFQFSFFSHQTPQEDKTRSAVAYPRHVC